MGQFGTHINDMTASDFFSCASILINSGSYEYKIGLFTRGLIGTHGNSNKLLNDQISKQHIHVDGVYQKLNHFFNIYFRVLVCTIRLGLNKTFLKMTDDILLTRPGFFFCPRFFYKNCYMNFY